MACDFYGGPAAGEGHVVHPGHVALALDVLGRLRHRRRPRPGDCVLGTVDFKGPGYQLSRMSYGGCDGNPAP
ncbi:hypothetical protein MAHJHV47_45090 [Mycobacterium avium subsp. hominissuis]